MLRIDHQRAPSREAEPGANRSFLRASEEIRFKGETREQVYSWIETVLRQQQYVQQGRKARGLLRRYLEKMTGLSRAQVTRLIARYQASGMVQAASYRRHRFAQRYTRADIELLAAVDEAHDSLSGPATQRILQREYQHYGKPSTRGWRPSRWPTCTICAASSAIANAD